MVFSVCFKSSKFKYLHWITFNSNDEKQAQVKANAHLSYLLKNYPDVRIYGGPFIDHILCNKY
jgi:hypothetical protein